MLQPEAGSTRHRRLIDLEGGLNFRDLGGYASPTGRSVVWRKLFRSGNLADLTQADQQRLARLRIDQLHDFRNPAEQKLQPDRLRDVVRYGDYRMPLGSISRIFQIALRGDITAKRSRRMMEEGYAAAALGLRGELGRFVRTVAAGDNATVVFHCTAGKDRTGMAAAVLLMALGVPENDIVEDYLLTLRHGKLDRVVEYIVTLLEQYGARRIDEAAILPYCTVAKSYIESFLAQVHREYRSHRDYLERGLGVAPAALARLQRFYLEG